MPAFSTPITYTDGVLVNAANLNSTAGNINTLALQTMGRTLASGKSSKPFAHYTCTGKSIASAASNTSTPTIITWNTQDVDTDGMGSAGATSLTIQTAGWYEVTLHVGFVAATSGLRSALILVNGTANPGNVAAQKDEAMGGTGGQHMYLSAHLYDRFQVGDVIRGGAIQDTGSAINTDTAFGGTWLCVSWDAPYS